MSQAREVFNPSSPHSSSGGADSYKHDGTPDTRLTAFSPDDALTRSSKAIQSLNIGANAEQTPVRFPGQTGKIYRGSPIEKDPFITGGTKLSATALAFQPVSAPVVGHGSRAHKSSGSAHRHALQSPLAPGADSQPSRYLVVNSAVDESVDVEEVNSYLRELETQGSASRGRCAIFPRIPDAYIQFNNIRDACDVFACIQIDRPEWSAEYLSPNDFNHAINPGFQPTLRAGDTGEGQVFVIAQLPLGWDQVRAENALNQSFSHKGEVLAFQRQADSNSFQLRAIVEFADVEVADSVASSFNGVNIHGMRLFISTAKPDDMVSSADGAGRIVSAPPAVPIQDISALVQGMSLNKSSQGIMSPGRQPQTPAAIQVYPQMPMYPMMYNGQFSPGPHYVVEPLPARTQPATPLTSSVGILTPLYTTPASTPLVALRDDFHSPRSMQSMGRPDPRRQNAVRVNRSSYYNAASHHNHVDVNRIREGIDVRTTIMLRNIPNKVDQAMLKRIIDDSSWGKYDFMYLRIDFANECNVGYAFINFVDPLDIIDFVNARGNQRWNCFKSDKVAEISYATIQGKDCLVQKFRNSSVMLEAPHYRPKLFYTSNGPQPEKAGQEEPFPDPDNHSKMKRSCENAEHVGLFTPNAGQHFRDEQRRRRSQYDRGTRLAALEEYDYENHLIRDQGMYPPQ